MKSVRTISSGVVFSSSSEKSGSRFAKPKSSSLRFTLLSATNLRIKTELIKFRFEKKRRNYINICLIYDIIIKITSQEDVGQVVSCFLV